VGDDRKLVTAVERSGADDGHAGPAGIGIVDAGETDPQLLRAESNVVFRPIVLKNPEIQFLENQAEVPSWADF